MSNLIDDALLPLPEDDVKCKLVMKELLLFYLVWKIYVKRWGTDFSRLSVDLDNSYLLFLACICSYEEDKEDNLFKIFENWSCATSCKEHTKVDVNSKVFPSDLRHFSSYQSNRYEEFNFHKYLGVDLRLDVKKHKEVAELIASSELLSPYVQMINKVCEKAYDFYGQDIVWGRKTPVPPNIVFSIDEKDKDILERDRMWKARCDAEFSAGMAKIGSTAVHVHGCGSLFDPD